MRLSRLGVVLAFAALGCNYIAPFDPEDQPLGPPRPRDDGDDEAGVEPDADVEPCRPDCGDRGCGPDGCGGSCGSGCGDEQVCVLCIPSPDAPCDDAYICQERAPHQWIFLSGDTFRMGSPNDEAGRDDDEAAHDVTLTGGFLVYSSELDQNEICQAMNGRNPSHVGSVDGVACDGVLPGEHLTWHEAATATNALSCDAELPECYVCEAENATICRLDPRWASPYECPGFRLPTEAEWEYAARAGTETAIYDEDLESIGWCCGSADATAPVGTKEPNAWGLHDVLGNVAEWCHDVYEGRLDTEVTVDPFGPLEGSRRVVRGGSWEDPAEELRAAAREGASPDARAFIGLRPVRSVW